MNAHNAVTVTAGQIEDALRQALQPEALVVTDDSAQHAGHAGSSGALSGTHFTVQVKARCFNGLSHVQRHRLVYDALRNLIAQGVHALAIKAEPV
ncbi:MAG: BolA family protein [Aquabacterium sp.]|uniref:BolA family protein n=1 Tax=Aquabacterium sp. TaxID=1872578 RepID=UPI0025CC106F|nr:BolA family protein [uncultured Aquabacterium sp.]